MKDSICRMYGVSFKMKNLARCVLTKNISASHLDLISEAKKILPGEEIDLTGAEDLLYHIRSEVREANDA